MINQLLPTLSYGDAVSNSAINIMNILRSVGVKSNIYAQNIHPKMSKYAKAANLCPKNAPIIYHLSTGSDLAYEIPKYSSKKILIYHNITPHEFFVGYSGGLKRLCEAGRQQLEFLSSHIDLAIADSEYNRMELLDLSYKSTVTSPIIINYDDYSKEPSKKVLNSIRNGNDTKNILFVGRIAPNKKQEDIIKSFYYYNKFINSDSKLYLVGSYEGMERYYDEISNLIVHLRLEQSIVITGHVTFDQILSYYYASDLFLCMSEHEGFCVPIIEAMNFRLPIIAYKSTAIPETLGNGGVLINKKDYKEVAELINIILSDNDLVQSLRENQQKQIKKYSKERATEQFVDVLNQHVL